MIGRRVLHFEILRELGHGGMGVVYEAHDTRLDRVVALKFLSRAGSPERLRPLIEEAIAASRLQVASVVTIHADYESPEGPFLCMELVPGGSLADRIAAGPMTLEETLGVALSVARSLEAAHAAGILHCDLKPGNVLLPRDGAVAAKVADFGLSRGLDEAGAAKRPRSGGPKPRTTSEPRAPSRVTTCSGPRRGGAGTPGYMSPEQMRGGRLDARSDLFALGVMLFEMATGRNPVLERLRGLPDAPSPAAGRRLRPDFPPAYWRLVQRLLAPKRDRRPRDAASVLRVLERLRSEAGAVPGETPPGAPPLFGREAELEALGAARSALFEGTGGAWLIEGQEGAGKTALAEYFRAESAQRGATVLRGSCLPGEAPIPYRPFVEALAGFVEAQGAGVEPQAFLQDTVGLPPELAEFLHFVLRFPRHPMPQMTGRAQLRDALRSFVQALARDRSVVLVVEDLHFADGASADLFASWAAVAEGIPLLLLGTCDPEQLPAARERVLDRATARTMLVGPLDRQATERLLHDLLPVLPPGHPGFDQVYWRSGGLPGFVVEIARLARRSGAALPAIERVLEGVMPESIRASLALRIDRLEREDLRLLRVAAVAGARFAPSVLVETGFADRANLLPRLRAFESEHYLIRRESEDRYCFDNPQVREFFLKTMPSEARRMLHGRFADTLANGDRDTPPEIMARHLLGAGRQAEAGRCLRAAAESALSVFAEEEALRLADLAERNLVSGRGKDAQRRDLHVIRARALESLGRYEEALGQAEAAVRFARKSGAKGALGESLVVLGSLQHGLGDTARAERTLRLAESECRAGRSNRGQARALLNRGHLRFQRGRLTAAARFYQKALEAARRGRDPVLAARARANVANVQSARGALEGAAEGYRETLEFHRRRGDRRTAATVEGNLGLIRLKQGRIDEARSLFAASLRAREEIGDRRGVAAMELRLARCSLTLGEPAVAAEHAGRARDLATMIGEPRLSLQAALIQAECALAGRAPARAEKRLLALLSQAEELGEASTVRVLELLARARVARGDLKVAAAEARKARRIAERLGNAADEQSTARVLARVMLAQRRPQEALRLLGVQGRGSATSERRPRSGDDFDGDIETALLLAAASRALSKRTGDANERLARAESARAEAAIVRVAEMLGSTSERNRYLARWRREKRRIDRRSSNL